MNLFQDFYFFIIAALLSIPAITLGYFEKKRKLYITAVNLIFIYLAYKTSLHSIFYLVFYGQLQIFLTWLFLELRTKKGKVTHTYILFICLSLAPLLIYKIADFYFGLPLLGFIGISYMSFRSLQVIIEIQDGLITKIDKLNFFNFITFFPTLLSGPIDRSRRFEDDLETTFTRDEYLILLKNGINKIMVGLLYKFGIASLLYALISKIHINAPINMQIIYMYGYGFYLFFDFAGYSLMAIGFGYIFGIRIPDNFNKPFLSKDIKDFWDRWHISLSHWFRDFVFSRLIMVFIRNKTFKDRLTMSTCAFIVNMTLMGLWHGLDSQYIIYGFYHGVILSLTEIYQKKSKFHKKNKKKKWYEYLSILITFNLVMFGFFIFSGRLTKII